MKTISAYIISLMLCLIAGAGICQAGAVEAESAQVATTVKVESGNVVVDNLTDSDIEVYVFSITGTVVRRATAPAGERLYIDLPSGFYIVKAGKHSQRVAVRG